MSDNQDKLLSQMLEKFRAKHGRKPDKIVVAPLALVSLAIKRTVALTWDGIPVECRLFTEKEVAGKTEKTKVAYLGVFMKENRGRMVLAACDLKVAGNGSGQPGQPTQKTGHPGS